MSKMINNDPVAGPSLNCDNDVDLLLEMQKLKIIDLEFVDVSVNALFLAFIKNSYKRRMGCRFSQFAFQIRRW